MPYAILMSSTRIAYGISVMLTDAGVLDTIVYWASKPLTGLSKGASVIPIMLVVLFVNMFITSASGKAPILMPIILPLCDLVGIEAQVATLCYQFGDVITNVLTPLSAFVLTCLGFARVPFTKWVKFVFPLTLIWFVMGTTRLGGGADSSYISQTGTPTVCSMGVRGEFNHTDREYALVDTLYERTKLLTMAVLRAANFS